MFWPILGPGFVALLEGVSAQNIYDRVRRHVNLYSGHLLRSIDDFRWSHNVFGVSILPEVEHLFARLACGVLWGLDNMVADWKLFGGDKGLSNPHWTLALTPSHKKVTLVYIGLKFSYGFCLPESKSGAACVVFESFNPNIIFIVFNNFIFKWQFFFLIFDVD